MAKMKLLKDKWRYAKQPLVAGDVFNVKDIHVPLLARSQIAEPVDAKAKALTKPKARTAAKKPATKAAPKAAPKRTYTKRTNAATPKRTYKRRDMKAEA